jgi:copper transport protein
VLLGLGAALAAVVLSAGPARAHAELVNSEPPDGAALSTAPAQVQLHFDEDISTRFRSARLIDGDGHPLGGAGSATGDPRTLSVKLPRLGAGAYGVLWQVLATDDGHTTSGVVVFSVGGAGPPSALAARGSAATESARPADVARRWLGLCLLAGVIGGFAVAELVLGAAGRSAGATGSAELAAAIRAARARVLGLVVVCGAAAVLVGLVDLSVEAARSARLVGSTAERPLELLTATTWGHLWLVREGALAALAVLALRIRSGARRSWSAPAAAGLVLAVCAAEALGGHAASAATDRTLSVAAIGVHVLTACCWLGAIPALAVALAAPAGIRGRLARACRLPFSRLLLISVLLVLVTGLLAAGRQIGYVASLTATGYGRTLLVKVGLATVLLVLGAVNATRWHGVGPFRWGRFRGRPAPDLPSRRLVLTEAGVGLLVLVAAGLLLETAPARGPVAPRAASAPVQPGAAAGAVDDLVVSVSASPNRPGVNGFTVLVASSRRPPPARIDGVVLALPQFGDAGPVTLRQIEPGRYFGSGLVSGPAGPIRAVVRIQRAGQALGVPVTWQMAATATPPPRPDPGPKLAPYTDLLAVVVYLLAAPIVVASWSRRRRVVGAEPKAADPDPPPAAGDPPSPTPVMVSATPPGGDTRDAPELRGVR